MMIYRPWTMTTFATVNPLPTLHFGEANAILAGDSLHSLAFQAVVDSDDW